MTVKRRDTGEEFKVNQPWTTQTFRTALLVLVASMHPVGREILHTVGFNIPRDPGVAVSSDLKAITDRLDGLEKHLSEADAKLATLTSRFGVFEVDFGKYRNESK